MKVGQNIFGKKERKRLEEAQRLLVNVQDPQIAPRALLAGYTPQEHADGWDYLNKAAGVDRPYEHFLAATSQEELRQIPTAMVLRIQELDRFENTWFPRTRNALMRFIDKEHRDKFVTTFFLDMPQMPEGPQVIGSVEKFLQRITELAKSTTPGADKAYQSLVSKGLTPELLQTMAKHVQDAKQAPEQAPVNVDAQELAQAEQRQREAFEALHLWYQDWSHVFREVMPYHMRLKLGLEKTRRKEGTKKSEDDDGTIPPFSSDDF